MKACLLKLYKQQSKTFSQLGSRFSLTYLLYFLLPVFMPKDKDTRKPKGFSFCQYKRKEDAEDAIKGMNGRVSWLDSFRHLLRLIELYMYVLKTSVLFVVWTIVLELHCVMCRENVGRLYV